MVLVRATAALKAAKDAPVGTDLPVSTWTAVMHSHGELRTHLEKALANQVALVTPE